MTQVQASLNGNQLRIEWLSPQDVVKDAVDVETGKPTGTKITVVEMLPFYTWTVDVPSELAGQTILSAVKALPENLLDVVVASFPLPEPE